MTYVLIALCSLAILIIIPIILGLILGIPKVKIKRNTVAVIVGVVVMQIVHVMYDIAAALKTANIEFYVALIGGAMTVVIYNAICNWKKGSEE